MSCYLTNVFSYAFPLIRRSNPKLHKSLASRKLREVSYHVQFNKTKPKSPEGIAIFIILHQAF